MKPNGKSGYIYAATPAFTENRSYSVTGKVINSSSTSEKVQGGFY